MDKGRKLEESLKKAWRLEEVTWWEREKREGRERKKREGRASA